MEPGFMRRGKKLGMNYGVNEEHGVCMLAVNLVHP